VCARKNACLKNHCYKTKVTLNTSKKYFVHLYKSESNLFRFPPLVIMSGWDDDDDLDDMLFDDEKNATASFDAATAPLDAVDTSNNAPPSFEIDTKNQPSSSDNIATEPIIQMCNDHEKMMENEISEIMDDSNEDGQEKAANEDDDPAWDFEDEDEDIFNEENDDLDCRNFLDDSAVVPHTNTTTLGTTITSSTTTAANAEFSHISPVANRTRSKSTTTPGLPPPPPKPQQQHHQVGTLNPPQQRIHQMLSNYITNLTNDDYISRLHYKLHLYQSQVSSSNRNTTTTTSTTAAAELRHYYAIRPKLRKYTLGVELDRMEYKLILENGTCTMDKDVIRSYFGVNDDGERGGMVGGGDTEVVEEATVEELLIRSANQSLLADALVALTGSEEDVVLMDGRCCNTDDFFDDNDEVNRQEEKEKTKSMGLILSGPTLCMSSVAETCQFTVDLQCGKVEALCDLAISVPFHGDVDDIYNLLGHENDEKQQQLGEQILGDGRIILARARVSVRFRPGGEGGDDNDEPTVQYAIQSVKSLLPSNSPVLRQVAIALAHDQEDPFFQEEQQQPRADVGDATDIRDLFLLNQHLLSDSGLLAVSDHLERLRGAAEAKSTGFRSALRQLDGVTNVSGKLQFLKGTANATRGQGGGGSGSGFLGLGLALPSAEEIEAAEREALSAVSTRQDDATFRFPRPDEVNKGGLRFPRPDDVNEGHSRPHNDRNARPPPPPPPPPGRPPQTEQNVARPKPIIGGMFMSGLSRLAAAATQPSDFRTGQEWGEEGGTGLTPPSSPKVNHFVQAPTNDFPTLYRKEEDVKSNFQFTHPGLGHGVRGVGGSATRPLAGPPAHLSTHQPSDQGIEFPTEGEASEDTMLDDTVEDDGGWSDDEFDFEEQVTNDFVEQKDISNEKEEKTTPLPPSSTGHADKEEVVAHLQHGMNQSSDLPSEAKVDMQQSAQSKTSKMFSEHLSTALQEKIESENIEIIQSGRLKRWTPLREDPILRQKLMEVMVNTLRD
jgi:hypothetical protein